MKQFAFNNSIKMVDYWDDINDGQSPKARISEMLAELDAKKAIPALESFLEDNYKGYKAGAV